ncbi:MAG: hypothetical protein ACMG57_00160 [Candidatus Dojkabacteria bacterium]
MPETLEQQQESRKLRYQDAIDTFNNLLADFINFQRQQYANLYKYYSDSLGPLENWPNYHMTYPRPFGLTDNPREPFSKDELWKSKPRYVSVKLDFDILDDFKASYKDSKYIDELIYILNDPAHCIWLQEVFDPQSEGILSINEFKTEVIENMRLRALQFLFLLSFKNFTEGDKYYQQDFFLNAVRKLAESTKISPIAFSSLLTKFEQNMELYIDAIEFKEAKNKEFAEDLKSKLELTTILYNDLVFATAEEG